MSAPLSTETVMDADTLEALRGSIAKWEGIVAGTTKNHCADNCPLCHKFNFSFTGARRAQSCKGCPVMERTGRQFCDGSPYEDYEDMEERVEEGYAEGAALKPLAIAEVDFLKSLLPKEAT